MGHWCFVSCIFHTFASVHGCPVVICREEAGLLEFLVMFIVFLLLSHEVSGIRCGT